MTVNSATTRPNDESWNEREELICDKFEDAWREGSRPKIEDYIAEAQEPRRSRLLRDLLDVELEQRRRRGEAPTFEEYERRFKPDSALVRAAFLQAGYLTPEWIDRFKVTRSLGGGGFGQVYLCYDDKLRRNVAIKVPRPDRLSSVAARELFLREARNVAALHHPAIVTLHDFGEADGQCYLVYEFIDGLSLLGLMKEASLPQDLAARVLAPIAEALHHAHAEDVYHRDIKPANILLDRRQQPYLTDFGLAVHVQDLKRERGIVAGTPHYMAPEQVRGDVDQIDGRADIYSLGVVLYELLTGQRPFNGRNQREVYEQILSAGEARPPCALNRAIRPDLQDICQKAMAKAVDARYRTAGEMAHELYQALTRSTQTATTLSLPMPALALRSEPSSALPPAPVLPKGLRSFGPEDKAFYLELLPGPRDRNRLPESVRFWKTRIESDDADLAFPVGLIYGPSGCGKSSLMKAGLIPQLARSIIPVYIEATRENTEATLLGQLCKRFPGLGEGTSLRTALARLRQNRGLARGSKLLIVCDQFEQWLHAHTHDMENAELTASLRQADGEHVQVILLVRSDFWMSISRFFECLKINLDRAHNTHSVDLFGESHAHHVLHLFGIAYGQLPAESGALSAEQADFLALAVRELSDEGEVIPVRLSLFAEMMKKRPWTRDEFKRIGGTGGIGRRFLEDAFGHPELRARKEPARAMLQALLPPPGADIKGPMRSRAELATACRLPVSAPAFVRLLESLRAESIITPADAPAVDNDGSVPTDVQEAAYYQLTHDFLVPSLREWLTEEKKTTRSGRAELRLIERAALWNTRPQARLLPSLWEYAEFQVLVPRRAWTEPQRRMMQSAGRHHFLRTCGILSAFLVAGWIAFETYGSVQAQSKLAELLAAEPADIQGKIKEIAPYRQWAEPSLVRYAQEETTDLKKRRNASLALLSSDASQADFLCDCLLAGNPDEVTAIAAALKEHRPDTVARFWNILEDQKADAGNRLRAASALAHFDPESQRWQPVSNDLVKKLITEPLSSIAGWKKALAAASPHLVAPLIEAARASRGSELERSVAVDLLADYARDLPNMLAELVMSLDVHDAAALLPALLKQERAAAAIMTAELKRTLTPDWKDPPLNPAWAVPSAKLVEAIAAAEGMLAERFAFCQTMPLEQFLPLTDALRPCGYRPICFRPYSVSEKVQVAAVWTRDGRPWQLACDMSAEEIRSLDLNKHREGLIPLDVAAYLEAPPLTKAGLASPPLTITGLASPPLTKGRQGGLSAGKERPRMLYAALWAQPDTQTTEAKLYVDVPGSDSPEWQKLEKAGFVPRTQMDVEIDGHVGRCAIWYKPGIVVENPFSGVGQDQTWYESHLTPSELLTDVRLTPGRLDKATTVEFSAVWCTSKESISSEAHGLDPKEHRARCQQLHQEGYRPVAMSIVHTGADRRLMTASAWHKPVIPDAAKEALAKKQARAAVTLFRLGQTDQLWSMLPFRSDPTLRTYVIHLFQPFGIDPQFLVRRLHVERDVSARRALLLALGEFPADLLPESARQTLIAELRQLFQQDPDPGIHSSVAWLLRRWGEENWLAQSETKLISSDPGAGRRWYVNGQGQTMAVIPGPVEFWMGSPGSEPERYAVEEDLHRARIPHSFAMATSEVTTAQFKRFLDANPQIRERMTRFLGKEHEPITHIAWGEAVQYCRWLRGCSKSRV